MLVSLAPGNADWLNVADLLTATARRMPDEVAVAAPRGCDFHGRRRYDRVTFRQLDADVERLARGLVQLGVRPTMRLVLLVPPSIHFVALAFALLRSAAVVVLIDPGMGRRNLIESLTDVRPDGFVAVPTAHFIRQLFASRLPTARIHVTVGRRWFRSGPTLDKLRALGADGCPELPRTKATDPAAIIFTSGGTGPAKGVLYQHANFAAQISQIRDRYRIQPGEIDLPGFPLFGLMNCAMGVTTVIPDMDASRPARVDPSKIVEAVRDWNVTQAFGSPAIWNRVGRYCEARRITLPSLRRVLSAGAPVPVHVLARMQACIHPAGEVHTPYGATEALPVASIAAGEVLGQTAARTALGAGVCVGTRFAGIDWKVIRLVDGAIPSIADADEVPPGETGELIVRGPQVTSRYVTRTQWNALTKIADADGFWHRMGDLGYCDEQGRFWFCGRVSHRVVTRLGPMDSARCESIFDGHPRVYRTALVGVGEAPGQTPVLVVEPLAGEMPRTAAARRRLQEELREVGKANPLTVPIEHFLLHRALPVDIRHNAKIARGRLAAWAAKKLMRRQRRSGEMGQSKERAFES